jgi:hypothetical protein
MLFFLEDVPTHQSASYDKNVPHDQPSCNKYKLAYPSFENSPLKKRIWSLLLGQTMTVLDLSLTSSWTYFVSCLSFPEFLCPFS